MKIIPNMKRGVRAILFVLLIVLALSGMGLPMRSPIPDRRRNTPKSEQVEAKKKELGQTE